MTQKDITIMPVLQIRLLGPENSYFIDKWKKENGMEELYDFVHVYVRSHALREIALNRPQIQTLLRRFLPLKPNGASYSEGINITSARMQDIYTAITSDEEWESGFRDYGGAGFFYAVIFDHSTLKKTIHDVVEQSEVADIIKEYDDKECSLGDILELQDITLRFPGKEYFLRDGFLSARDLNDIETICRQLDRDYVSPDTLGVCTYYCILRLLGALNHVAGKYGPFTLADLKTDEELQKLFFSKVRYVLHYTGPLTNYAMLRMLKLLREESLTANQKNDEKTTFSSDAGFSISYSRAWRIATDPSFAVQLYIYVAHAKVGEVGVEASDLVLGATLEELINPNLEGLTNFKDYTLISSEDVIFADRPACRVVWQATVPIEFNAATAARDMLIKAMQVFVINNQKGYRITYTTTPEDFDKYLSQAQDVIDSFEFI